MHGIFGALLKEQSSNLGGVSSALKREVSSIPVLDDDSVLAEEGTSIQLKKGQIAVDIFEEDGYFIIRTPIAGVKLGDLDIDVAENVVTIRGRREQTDVVDDAQYILRECYFGDFERKVTLPCTVNPAKVRATFSRDNVLKIFVPRDEARKVRIVKINEGM